jgi:hypothetical protein
MTERTAKMTESHRDVGVRGWSARSGPRWLNRRAAWTGGALSTQGVCRSTWGAHGDGLVGCAPLARSLTGWLV